MAVSVSLVLSRLWRFNSKRGFPTLWSLRSFDGMEFYKQTLYTNSTSSFLTARYMSAAQLNSSNVNNSDQHVQLSDSCAKQLNKISSNEVPYLRVSVEGGGCSGFQYKFDLDSVLNPDDRVFEKNGAKLVIDETSLEYLSGSTVDYHEELIRSAFRILSNPKAQQGCSCGASFAVKID